MKVVKGNLVMARGRKRGSLYMVGLPFEGVTVPIRKINKVWFTESRGQKRVVFTRENPEPHVRIRMNKHGKVQVDQSKVLMEVGARVVLQPRFLDDSGLGEPVF